MMRMRRSQVMALSWFHLVFLDILRVSVKKSREFKVWVSVDTKFWIRLNKLSSELREISGSHSRDYSLFFWDVFLVPPFLRPLPIVTWMTRIIPYFLPLVYGWSCFDVPCLSCPRDRSEMKLHKVTLDIKPITPVSYTVRLWAHAQCWMT